MEENRSRKWLMPVGIGCLVLLCICIGLFAAIYVLGDRFTSQLPFDIDQFTDGDFLPVPEEGFGLNDGGTADDTTRDEDSLSSGQTDTGTYFADDFSTTGLGWVEYDDGSTIIKYEDGAYSFEVTEPDYLDWTYVPTSFLPTTIQFDVRGRTGPQDGSFGVNCNYLDEDNHYYVEIDLGFQDAIFAMVQNGEFVPLTEETSEGQYWQKLTYLESPPETVNNIKVTCTQQTITLWVNGQFEYEIQVSDPFTEPGDMALFVYTYDYATDGYKVYFDNVIVE
jgi:hypothetical protein